MKKTFLIMAISMVGVFCASAQTLAKPNEMSASEVIGLKEISATAPIINAHLRESTAPTDPSTLANKSPKVIQNDKALPPTSDDDTINTQQPLNNPSYQVTPR